MSIAGCPAESRDFFRPATRPERGRAAVPAVRYRPATFPHATAPRRPAKAGRRGAGQDKPGRLRQGSAHKANGLVGSWFQLGLLLKGDKQLPRRGEAA